MFTRFISSILVWALVTVPLTPTIVSAQSQQPARQRPRDAGPKTGTLSTLPDGEYQFGRVKGETLSGITGGQFVKRGNVIEGGFANVNLSSLCICFRGKIAGNVVKNQVVFQLGGLGANGTTLGLDAILMSMAGKNGDLKITFLDEPENIDFSNYGFTPINSAQDSTSFIGVCARWNHLYGALDDLESTAQSFIDSLGGITDAAAREALGIETIRELYSAQIRKAANEILLNVWNGEITSQEGSSIAVELRNQIMEAWRKEGSDIAAAISKSKKATGRTLAELQDRVADDIFKKPFSQLSELQKDRVWLQIIRRSGKPDQKATAEARNFGIAGRVLIIATYAISAYRILMSDNKVLALAREGAIRTAASIAWRRGGALAISMGLCAAEAPICISIAAFVTALMVAEAVDNGFDLISEWLREESR